MTNRKIVLDTETTGLDYILNDRIIEIAAVEILDDKTLGKEFHSYINPQIKIDEASIKIHNITDDMVKDKPKFCDIAQDLLDFIGDSLLIAHNAEFDRAFLNLELYLIKKQIFPQESFIDTLNLARTLFKGEKYSLDDLCLKFNIDTSSRNKGHGALIDTKLLAKVYIEIMNIINSNFLCEQSPYLKDLIIKKILRQKPKKFNYNQHNFIYRNFDLTQDEIKNHNEFLKKIKNPLWLKENKE